MSAKLLLLVIILVAGIISHQYKQLTYNPSVEVTKYDRSQH